MGADDEEEDELQRLEAVREAEERRKAKHEKMERKREKMRQEIRDKYNIKPKEDVTGPPNPLMRQKKTPEELAREAVEEDELTKLKNSLKINVNDVKLKLLSKCVVL